MFYEGHRHVKMNRFAHTVLSLYLDKGYFFETIAANRFSYPQISDVLLGRPLMQNISLTRPWKKKNTFLILKITFFTCNWSSKNAAILTIVKYGTRFYLNLKPHNLKNTRCLYCTKLIFFLNLNNGILFSMNYAGYECNNTAEK